ncbi:MAG: hypothetical protein ACO1NK_07205 [Sediminibacterium sp.]
MRRVIAWLFFLMICTSVDAQRIEKPFAIEYKSGYLALTDSLQVQLLTKPKKYHPLKDYEIIVTGDLAFVNFMESEKDKNLGTNFRHDNIYSDFIQQKEYHQIQRDELNNQRLLVERNFPALQFDRYQDSIKIFGYTCYKAMPARNNYSNAVV